MRTIFAHIVVLAALVLVIPIARTEAAQAPSTQKFFTRQAPWLCAGAGFVAMVPLARPQMLFVVRIDASGIQPVEKVPTTGDEVFGLICAGSHIELRVRKEGTDHFSVLPFTVRGGAITPDEREDIDWSISQKPTMPPAIEGRIAEFSAPGLRSGAGMRGNWYVQVAIEPGRTYEVHYVIAQARTRNGLMTTTSVTLLEETLKTKKVTKSVPLVREKRFEAAD